MSTTYHRKLEFDRAAANDERRTVPVTLSTTYPVDRGGWLEVLDHSPESVDLSRAPLPVIESHDNGRL
ncbi:MAG: phage major capsid protein, partial [Candidatus Competibacteraceae bacterium]|nr:phage major capsid protein [Candidatus Competibacteraceae bacterium]